MPANLGTVLAQGGNIVARRQPDINVPLGVAPYTPDSNIASFGGFTSGALWPSFVNDLRVPPSGGPFYAKIEAINAFAKGTQTFNPANSGVAGTGAIPTVTLRHGDIMMTQTIDSSNNVPTTKSVIIPGTNLITQISSYSGLNEGYSDFSSNFGTGLAPGNFGNSFLMVDNRYNFFIPNIYMCLIVAAANTYSFIRTSINFSLRTKVQGYNNANGIFAVGNRDWDWMWGYNASLLPGVSTYPVRAVIPDFRTFKNYVAINSGTAFTTWPLALLMLDGSIQGLVPQINSTINGILLDNATLQATVGAPLAVMATAFGFLIQVAGRNAYFDQFQGYILLSPDMTKYALVKLFGLNPTTQSDIMTGSQSGIPATIDPMGIFYYWGASASRMNTGFNFNISWSPVNFQIDPRQPSFLIPNLCGCNPLSAMGIMDRSLLQER